ncbi:MAG: hypothetical protein V3V08_07275 [Nannocystaceae bacterium]
MKAKYNSDEEWAADRMKYLIGYKLTDVTVDDDGFPKLVFQRETGSPVAFAVFIQQDAEGNGPGFMDIQPGNDEAARLVTKMQDDHKAARKAS